MWVRASSRLTESTWQITTAVSSHLFVNAEKSALVDSSIAAISAELIDAVNEHLGPDRELDYILISHVHFDHVGSLVALREAFPSAKMIASRQSANIISEEAVRTELFERNREASRALGRNFDFSRDIWDAALEADEIVRDGDVLELGNGVVVKLIECPGHTVDSLVYYVYPDEVFAGSEALGGYAGKGKYLWSFYSSYESYLNSIERLSSLAAKAVVFPHNGSLTGDMARRYFFELSASVKKFAEDVRQSIANGEVREEIVQRLFVEWKAQGIAPDGPFIPPLEENLRAMVSLILESP